MRLIDYRVLVSHLQSLHDSTDMYIQTSEHTAFYLRRNANRVSRREVIFTDDHCPQGWAVVGKADTQRFVAVWCGDSLTTDAQIDELAADFDELLENHVLVVDAIPRCEVAHYLEDVNLSLPQGELLTVAWPVKAVAFFAYSRAWKKWMPVFAEATRAEHFCQKLPGSLFYDGQPEVRPALPSLPEGWRVDYVETSLPSDCRVEEVETLAFPPESPDTPIDITYYLIRDIEDPLTVPNSAATSQDKDVLTYEDEHV